MKDLDQGEATGSQSAEIVTPAPIAERLRSTAAEMIDFHGETMKEWDKIRALCAKRDGSDLPRLMFEGLLESFSELMVEAADEIARLRTPLEDLASYELIAVGFNGAFTKSDLKDCLWIAGFAGRQPEFRHFEAARAALTAADGEA